MACSALAQDYQLRTEQQAVAALVEAALSRQEVQTVGILPVEAGTGTGKTLAYLVPGALHASARGSRLITRASVKIFAPRSVATPQFRGVPPLGKTH